MVFGLYKVSWFSSGRLRLAERLQNALEALRVSRSKMGINGFIMWPVGLQAYLLSPPDPLSNLHECEFSSGRAMLGGACGLHERLQRGETGEMPGEGVCPLTTHLPRILKPDN